MKKGKLLNLCLNSVFAGICIAFAAILYLYAMTVTVSPSALERAVYGLLFGFGLYFIIVMEYKLFTGMVAGLTDMKPREYLQLIFCYVFNTFGIVIIGTVFYFIANSVSKTVIDKAVSVLEGKLANDLFGSFFSAVLCGMMITFSVKSHQKARDKGLSGTLGVIFPILLFVYMGFEHCIANQAYIYLAILGKVNVSAGRLLLFMLLTAIGNVLGGVFIPFIKKLADSKNNE